MPKSLYKRIRDGFDGSDIVISQKHSNSSQYSDFQVKANFLCEECEQLFSRNGENVVVRECHGRGNQFNLLKRIKGSNSAFSIKGERWVPPHNDGSFFENEYLYFAASIFWRSSSWPSELHSAQNSLGAKYQEQFRRYLLGKDKFPENAYLCVYVDSNTDITPLISFPTVSKKNGYHHHIFYIPGVKFSLVLGSKVGGIEEMSKKLNTNIFFVEYDFKRHNDYSFFADTIQNQLEPKGRLANEPSV